MEVAIKLSFKLHRLKCLLNSEDQGDEIYVKYQGRKIWPENKKWHRIVQGDEIDMDVVHPVTHVGGKIVIELWECDLLTKSNLGNFTFLADSPGGPFTVDMITKNSKAKYSLVWEAVGSRF